MSSPTQPAPQSRDDHQTAFFHFDSIDEAVTDLESTLAIMSTLIDNDCELNADTVVTLERHLKTDFLALAAAAAAAREAILPLLPRAEVEGKTNERSAQRPAFEQTRPSACDMELAIQGLDGIFTVLNWIDSGSLDDGFRVSAFEGSPAFAGHFRDADHRRPQAAVLIMTPDDTVTSVTLNSTDGTLVWMASRLLLALPGGPERIDAMEQLVQHYRDDLADAYDGTDPDTLDDMATNFGGALMLRMLRLVEEDDPDDDTPAIAPLYPPGAAPRDGRYRPAHAGRQSPPLAIDDELPLRPPLIGGPFLLDLEVHRGLLAALLLDLVGDLLAFIEAFLTGPNVA